ncbi:hypothetical protein INT47_005600 [Mucor saturninus]|uniref:OPT family small oligopeptide transporter n=1 Tax=Mucor saturninus TaxID=64648 RepID=A0A8H7QLM0_9FUNG|nr:hypothetical protein INT47_005600 [Mucor saturninus]
MKEEENHIDEQVISDKVEEEKPVFDDEKHAESWLQDSKDMKLDPEGQSDDFLPMEDDIDIAIVNDLAVTEDDATLRSVTVRSIIVGTLLSILSSSVSQLMVFKPVGIALTSTFMLILAYVFCTAWARFLPKGGWLNPGPLNVKEHACIYIMISAANVSAYATYVLSAQQLFYTDSPGAAGGIFLLLGTQLVGYGIAGQLRPYLVYPSNMIWPLSLPVVSLLKTFNTNAEEAKSRTRFFFIVFGGIFIYEFIPQYMFPMLGGVSIVCLAKDNSPWVQRLFGGIAVNEGMGMFQLSFDWNFLSFYTPLTIPLWVQLNVYFGILVLWIMAPLVYYYDVWNAQSFPYLSNSIFKLYDNGTSEIYPQHEVLNSDNSLNHTLLEEVGSPQFSAVFAVNYVLGNFAVTATITHVALFYGKEIWSNFRTLKSKIISGDVDIHMKLMQAYPEVPSWWYYSVYIFGIALNIGIAYANHSQLPWWGVIFAIVISTVLSLPLNLISAVTGYGFGLNVLTEMICGFVLPGYPIANMYFKTLGYNTISQAGVMAKDLKIGHYLKVPPKMTFLHQILGTIIGCIFNYVVNDSITTSEREILLDPVGNQFWNGASPQTINSAGITWGAIGPAVMFGPNTQYYIILWAFVIGFFIPIPFWILHKKFPNIGFNYINIPMILTGVSTMPGVNTSWVTLSFVLILISQCYLKRRHSAWFVKNNYLISAALDSGTSLMVFLISLIFYGAAGGTPHVFPTWWGNNADALYVDNCCLNC